MTDDNKKGLIENEYPLVPRPAVGTVVVGPGGKILLIKRGKPPAEGLWSVPGGSIELGETIFQCAEREVFEETGIKCAPARICNAVDAVYRDKKGAVRFHYVIVYVVACFKGGKIRARDDAADAAWFSLDEVEFLDTPGRTVQLLRQIDELKIS